MNEQKESKNKIGARCLSDLEAELIMPNYKRIYYQIDQFRTEKTFIGNSKGQKVNGADKDQKTNNIGIIGVRGAGKTSILKTIRVQLEKNKHTLHDIILPIIVPENMSESGTLMATVLGMLNEVIKERDEQEKNRQKKRNVDCIKKTELRKKYDEVIKQYTYIQKEYRDILISQYTTENDYVNRSTSVFNSDTEFINKFHELVDELVDAERQDGSLLFLFIDDIDLSTYRCADVVKTLLSYLSNENIVTFISGDLETFEEALTLDFLRQENVLNKDILDKKIGSNALLDSKQKLAYEYLKKIIPPAYRYHIKFWSLEEKGNYCIAEREEIQRKEALPDEANEKGQKAGITLSELLVEKLKGWVDPAFFCYAQIRQDMEDEKQEESEKRNLPYTYHLFDHTSRGLNNVYNVLGEISTEKKEQGKDYSKEKKLLLDTIISSKPIYNKYRTDIQLNFFHIGTNTDSRVFFDNAEAVIYKSKDPADHSQGREEYEITDPVERFSLFILVDFAARLLYEVDNYEERIKEDECYKNLKDKAMKDLFFHPVIAEKVMEVSNYRWESVDEKRSKDDAQRKGIKEYPTLKEMKLKDVNGSFLLKGDLILNLAYYKNLPLDRILRLYEDRSPYVSNTDTISTAELEQDVVIAMWKSFSSIAKVNSKTTLEIIARHYPVFWKEFAYIRNQLSSSVAQNIVIRIFSDEINAVVKGGSWEEKRTMNRILSNTLARILAAQDQDEIEEEWKEIYFDNLYVEDKSTEEGEKEIKEDKDREDLKRKAEVLKAIHSGILWQVEAAENAAVYLKRMVDRYLEFIQKAVEGGKHWKLKTSDAEESWENLQKIYAGVSNTKAKCIRNNVSRCLDDKKEEGFQEGMSFETYGKVIKELGKLAGNNRVRYGQYEAQQILNELQKASAEPKMQNTEVEPDELDWDTWVKRHSYFAFLLQCLYKYKMEAEQSKNIIQNARLLSEIAKKLPDAHKEADRQVLENFIDELNKNLEQKIDSKDFEELFKVNE